MGKLVREDRGHQRLGVLARTVVDDEAHRPEPRLEQAPEGFRHRAAVGVGPRQRLDDVGRELGRRQRRSDVVERCRRPRVEQQLRDRRLAGASQFRHRDRVRVVFSGQDGRRRDLVPIVILAVDPENRHDWRPRPCLERPGHLDGRERLEQGVKRSAEKACLLPGDDGDGVRVAEAPDVGDGRGRGAAPDLLPLDDVGDAGPWAGMGLGSRNRVGPGRLLGGIAGVEGRKRREIVRVRRGQPTHPRQRPEVDRSAGNGGVLGSGTVRLLCRRMRRAVKETATACARSARARYTLCDRQRTRRSSP